MEMRGIFHHHQVQILRQAFSGELASLCDLNAICDVLGRNVNTHVPVCPQFHWWKSSSNPPWQGEASMIPKRNLPEYRLVSSPGGWFLRLLYWSYEPFSAAHLVSEKPWCAEKTDLKNGKLPWRAKTLMTLEGNSYRQSPSIPINSHEVGVSSLEHSITSILPQGNAGHAL